MIETAHGLGITSLRELSFHPPLGCEFYVCLADGGAGPGLSLDALRRASEEEQLAGLLERFDLLPSRPGAGPADAPGGEAVGDLVVKHLRATYADLEERRVQVQSLTNQVAGGWSVVERSRLEASLATTERRVAELRDQIEGLHRSNSWRVTKPARALTRMLHEAKGRLLSGPHVGGLRTP